MNSEFVVQLALAMTIAVTVVRCWKAVVAFLAVVVLTLTVVGAFTVWQNLPWR